MATKAYADSVKPYLHEPPLISIIHAAIIMIDPRELIVAAESDSGLAVWEQYPVWQ